MTATTGKPMRLILDGGLCEGHGVCVGIEPRLFQLDDVADRVRILLEPVPESLHDAAAHAVQRCPRAALRLG